MQNQTGEIKGLLRGLLAVAVCLIAVGLLFIYSASSVFALERHGAAHYFLKRQAGALVVGLSCFIFLATRSLEQLRRVIPLLFWGAMLLSLLTLVPALGWYCHGSRRWLVLAGISMQPSEFLKCFLFLYVALFLERRRYLLKSFVYTYLPLLLLLGVISLILLKQPDFGSVITIMMTMVALFYFAGIKQQYISLTMLVGAPVLVALVVTQAYRLRRVLIFLNPWVDPQGKGFQIIQSLIAIGSGGIWGVGISNSKQKFFYLPMQHTDFIFSIIAEETGFVGSMMIITLYALFMWYGVRLLMLLKNPLSCYATFCFVFFMNLQAMMNLLVVTGMVPTKGLGLPFVSYGGSSLISYLCMLGCIVAFVQDQLRAPEGGIFARSN